MQYNLNENEAVGDEDENKEDHSYSRSIKRPLKSGKEQSKVSIDFKSAAGEVVTLALEYFKEEKHGKILVDADATFGQDVAYSLRAMKDVHIKEYAKIKIQEILFQCSFSAHLQKRTYNSNFPFTKFQTNNAIKFSLQCWYCIYPSKSNANTKPPISDGR